MMSFHRPLELECPAVFTRHCPETGEEVEVEVTLRGTWFKGEPGSYWDPPIPPGVEDLWAEANGREFPLSERERDWAAEQLGESRDE